MYQATAGWIQRNRALILLVGLLLIVRIPHFNRPLSKHHDFNNAVMLINAASWQQGGGGASFWFTPLMNFQGEQNKLLERGPHIDTNSNHTYISYGPGFFMLPYFVFQALHIPPSPAVLELLNILLGLATMLLLYHLLHNWLNNKRTALM